MTWKASKIEQLKYAILAQEGRGESRYFYELRREIIAKLGRQAWEKMLYETKVTIAKESVDANR